jgi:hypothetical protein
MLVFLTWLVFRPVDLASGDKQVRRRERLGIDCEGTGRDRLTHLFRRQTIDKKCVSESSPLRTGDDDLVMLVHGVADMNLHIPANAPGLQCCPLRRLGQLVHQFALRPLDKLLQ